MRSIKHECLNQVIPFGERRLRRTLAEFVAHYHRERNHQGLDNQLIDGVSSTGNATGDRKSTRLNSSHIQKSRMPSSA